jgi:hypothetical protein
LRDARLKQIHRRWRLRRPQAPAQLILTTPPVSLHVQKFPVLIPTGMQPTAGLPASGQRHVQDVGDDTQAAGVGLHDCPVCPAVPGVYV